MTLNTIQDLLSLIEKPSSYLGSEINAIKKNHLKTKLRFLLAFPDLYEIGTSHFGLQILYHILNSGKAITAERVFAPGVDMASYLKSFSIPLFSLETKTPVRNFDIIGFSLLYELNYTNILTMLDLAKIPFFSSQRDEDDPIIIAGGPCTCNPEPIADFFDAIVVGDGESVIMEMSRSWIQWKQDIRHDKEKLLKDWSSIEGVYVPGFFEPEYNQSGFQSLQPKFSDYTKVTRAIVDSFDPDHFPITPILPFGRPVHDRLRLEVTRGCTRGCRFCQAGMIYRPVRERSPEELLVLAEKSIAATGYEDISLLSLSTGDYCCLAPLMEKLMDRYLSKHVAISFPSVRAGTLTPRLMSIIKKVRKTGFTIAPEAGSQRLRNIINKNITEKEIFETVTNAFDLGWQVIKLYFMIGLPTETDDDLKAIIQLVKDLRKIKGPKGRKGKINVSVATFIPKPHIPFQWVPQIGMAGASEKIHQLKKALKIPGVQVKWQNPETSLLEGLWARGDRRLSHLLVAAFKRGCKFDGWSETFQYQLWEDAFSDAGTDVDFYTTRIRNMTEPLPWDHIDTKISKAYLTEEWEKAVAGNLTSDCRNGSCNSCGVCDFITIQPKIFSTFKNKTSSAVASTEDKETLYKKIKISYSKQGQARYFGHLELVNIFIRALRRADIPVKFSQGFHPKPKISFEDPLPVGMESLCENLYVIVPDNSNLHNVKENLNNHLPDGLKIIDCLTAPSALDSRKTKTISYFTLIRDASFSETALQRFVESTEFVITRTDHKGKLKKTDLKDMIIKMNILASDKLWLIIKSSSGKIMRPAEVLRNVFSLPESTIKQAVIVKVPGKDSYPKNEEFITVDRMQKIEFF